MALHKRNLILLLVTLLFIFSVFPSTHGFAEETNATASTTATPSFNENDIVPGKVIVKYRQQPAANGINSLSSHSASSWTTISFSNEQSVADKIAELQKDPNIDYAEPVYKVHLISSSSGQTVTQSVYSGAAAYMEHWGKLAAHVDDLSAYSDVDKNKDVTVAVMDTGIDMAHLDLHDAIVQGYDFVNKDNNAQDDNDHGTHVSGIIAAQSHGGVDVGIAHGVKIMPLKVLDNTGGGDTSFLIQAFQYAIDQHVVVINMSLGGSGNSKALHDVIKQAHESRYRNCFSRRQ